MNATHYNLYKILLACIFTMLAIPPLALAEGENSSPAPQSEAQCSNRHIDMDVSTHLLTFGPDGGRTSYKTIDAVGIAAGGHVPWRIYCEIDSPSLLFGVCDNKPEFFVLPDRDPYSPENDYSGQPIQISDKPQLVAQGGPKQGRIAEVNRLRFIIKTDAIIPAHTYTGHIHLTMVGKKGTGIGLHRRISYKLPVEKFLELSVNPKEMNFSAGCPGTHYCDEVITVTAITNHALGKLELELSDLAGVQTDFTIPAENVTVKSGLIKKCVLERIRRKGKCGVLNQMPLHFGKNTFYMAGRVETDMDMPAGDYKGVMRITAHTAR